VYHLRPGVKFWDGRPLTAQDVANAVNYYRDPGSTNAFLFSSVKSVVALDKSRVAFTLKHADATFKWVPAQYSSEVFEKAFGDAHKGSLGRPGVGTMGTGPWKIVSFDPTQGLELAANDKYWGGKPQIRRISVKFFADENSMALAFRAGEIDVAPLVLGAQAFASTANTKLISKPSCQTAIFTMNTQAPPFNDIHVRRAVAYATNRADLIKANGGYASPNYAIIPRVHLLGLGPAAQVDKLLNSLPQYRYDLTKAKQEIAQSKYANGFSFDMVEFAFGTFNNVSQAIAGQLSKIGLKANVKIVSPGEWYASVTGPNDKRPEIFSTVGCNSPDPSFITTLILGKAGLRPGSFNIANYAPNDVEQLIQSGLQVTNRAKRLVIYGKILQRVGQDVPYVPLWVQSGNAALSS
jgi:peptide/nickel transport system substrate-binding protein